MVYIVVPILILVICLYIIVKNCRTYGGWKGWNEAYRDGRVRKRYEDNRNQIQNRRASKSIENADKPKRAVNKWIYFVLALVGGSLGFHEFYRGRKLRGVLCILFCATGLSAVYGVICAIIALTKDADENGNICFESINNNYCPRKTNEVEETE